MCNLYLKCVQNNGWCVCVSVRLCVPLDFLLGFQSGISFVFVLNIRNLINLFIFWKVQILVDPRLRFHLCFRSCLEDNQASEPPKQNQVPGGLTCLQSNKHQEG